MNNETIKKQENGGKNEKLLDLTPMESKAITTTGPDIDSTEIAEMRNGDTYKSTSFQLMHTIQQLNSTADRLDDFRVLSRFHLFGWIVTLISCPIILLAASFYMPDSWKLNAVTIVMGTENSWDAGHLILSKADYKIYQRLITAEKISKDNKKELKKCLGLADATNGPVNCELIVRSVSDD